MKDEEIKYDVMNDSALLVDMELAYLRRFNYGGKALNKPAVSHSVTVKKDNEKLASFGRVDYTTKYAFIKDAAVNLEISAFKWGAEDEPKDIDLVAKIIVEDLAGLGG